MRNKDLEKIWDGHWKNSIIESSKMKYHLKEIESSIEEPHDILHFYILSNLYNYSIADRNESEIKIISYFRNSTFSNKELYLIFFFKHTFSEAFHITLDATINRELSKVWNFAALSSNFSNFSKNHWCSLKKFMTQREGVKLVLFLRRDRKFIGRMVLLNSDGSVKRNWSLPALCKGRANKPFYVSNGQTPCGIYQIDSVMPKANEKKLFGNNRRLKLEFESKETLESLFDELLLEHHFWKEAIIAKELGRSLLRIHGTGLKNNNFFSGHYPHVTTSGCVSMRETSKEDHQRELLDSLMKSLNLETNFANEVLIKGTLVVVELDESKKAVESKDIEDLDQ